MGNLSPSKVASESQSVLHANHVTMQPCNIFTFCKSLFRVSLVFRDSEIIPRFLLVESFVVIIVVVVIVQYLHNVIIVIIAGERVVAIGHGRREMRREV